VLIAYWLILLLFGGDDPYSLNGNIAGKIDVALFGANHVYKGFGIPFDPEGLLSTLPAMINVVLGYIVGEIIGTTSTKNEVVKKLFLYGGASLIIALIWGLFFPINKPIWTSSYVLYSVGLGMILLAILIWIIDIKGQVKWAHPFLVYGMNPLMLFVSSVFYVKFLFMIHIQVDGEILNGYAWLYRKVFAVIGGDGNFGSFLFAAFTGIFIWLIGYIMYKKKIFIKI
jgi:predicted acyltransferase